MLYTIHYQVVTNQGGGMFGHDDNQDKQDDNLGSSPIQPTIKPEPKPDGVLDDNTAILPPTDSSPAKGLPFTPPPKPAGPPPPPPSDDNGDKNDKADGAPPNDDLLLIKQEALKQLSPLVDHLDQTPEEKFRTTMMMIQASDDDGLVKAAFEAAKGIKDDKARAQAFLDVINEINYFTQQPES